MNLIRSMSSPEELYNSGIYVNDLSMHDSSRDMILAGSQRDPELKIALSQVSIQTIELGVITSYTVSGEDQKCSVGRKPPANRSTPISDDP